MSNPAELIQKFVEIGYEYLAYLRAECRATCSSIVDERQVFVADQCQKCSRGIDGRFALAVIAEADAASESAIETPEKEDA